VRGTDFRAHVDDSGQGSRSEVLSGMVQASGARGKAVALPAGLAPWLPSEVFLSLRKRCHRTGPEQFA